MEDILLLEAIERYLNGTMLPAEKAYFEQLRKNTPEIDQMVVEHKLFLQQMDNFSEYKNLKNSLHEAHNKLVTNGDIYEGGEISRKGRVVQLWNKYRRVTAIAASIAGITAIIISALFAYFTPTPNPTLEQLNRKVNNLERTTNALNSQLKNNQHVNIPAPEFKSAGTGFLIDGKGYIITNAHVLTGTGAVVVNNKGEDFNARIINIDQLRDLAILRIDDSDFRPYNTLPYSIKKSDVELGEELFTLGYPRDEIVYNMGYLSAESGYNGDTASCQISLNANPGNSGGPVFNKNGEIVGILSAKQPEAEGVVFAIKVKSMLKMIDELKNTDSSFQKIKMPANITTLRGVNRVDQIKQVEDYVFLVKAYNQK
ncbi:MAG TPA: serine protease [Chitinophagaceae bacterium]|jgi:S1-C subfamily serine protease